ncbi:fetuin-B-like [Eublepharis macularius]|uniref:Fetuin-B-like n=1 Tax=Eublepharis macularius TaxID=481883 RepID=A0AA97L2I1_EUBMA|nr:fetuin-B-like [Eublepharis macularius]
MAFLISLLIGIQILCSLAVSPPRREPPPPPPDRLLSPSCNSSAVKIAADLALEKLNADRREGYVLGLQRIFDVHQLRWQSTGDVFYLTLDVLETNCHILTRKSWKDCKFRPPHETVYGQCKVTFYINKPWRILHLYNYDCVLRPLPASAITKFCPDCPIPLDPSEPRYQEVATLSLAKFNAESNHVHYFNVRNVTKARSQWVVGPSDFVEYIIQETSCSKSKAVTDLSNCPFLPDETAEVGVCRGSVIDSQIERKKLTSAECEIFHKQPQVTEGEQPGKRKGGHRDGGESHEGDGDSKSRKNGHRDHHHQRHHPHDRRHGDHSHDHAGHGDHSRDHAEHEQNPPTTDTFQIPTDLGKTVGRVKVLPLSNTRVPVDSLPEIGAEQLDGIPVPPESQQPKPNPSLPDIHGAPEGSRPLGKPGLTKPAKPLSPPPFPAGFSDSDTCPGEILVFIYGLEPLLPKRPVEVSPTGAAEFQEKVKH